MFVPRLLLPLVLVCLSSCASQHEKEGITVADDTRWKMVQSGKASYYGGRWHRRPTASGERYDQNSLTAAHKTLPFGTKVRVTNLRNGRSCEVRINNRGPYVKGRVIDLSMAAAKQIGAVGAGVVPVKIEVRM